MWFVGLPASATRIMERAVRMQFMSCGDAVDADVQYRSSARWTIAGGYDYTAPVSGHSVRKRLTGSIPDSIFRTVLGCEALGHTIGARRVDTRCGVMPHRSHIANESLWE